MPPFVSYKDDYYPHLALKVALKYLKDKEGLDIKSFKIDKKGNLVLGKRVIPLNYKGSAILNWYGPSGLTNKNTFEYVPVWKVEKQCMREQNLFLKITLKEKLSTSAQVQPLCSTLKVYRQTEFFPEWKFIQLF